MAFVDPQEITVGIVTTDLPRIKSEGFRSQYRSADENLELILSHQEAKTRTRRMVRINFRTVAANPLTAVNEYKTGSVYAVIDEPEYGFDDAALTDYIGALCTWLGVASNVEKLLAHQH